MTAKDFSGKYVMNHTLSTPNDDVLAAQGVGYVLRTAIYYATITVDIRHGIREGQVEHLEIDNTATGGLKGTTIHIILDNEIHAHYDYVFGAVTSQALRVPIEELEYFKDVDWDVEASTAHPEGVGQAGILVVRNGPDETKREDKWSAYNVWGYEFIEGKKTYVRRIHFWSPKLTKDLVVVYDEVKPDTEKFEDTVEY